MQLTYFVADCRMTPDTIVEDFDVFMPSLLPGGKTVVMPAFR
jgi:hypothetical protein